MSAIDNDQFAELLKIGNPVKINGFRKKISQRLELVDFRLNNMDLNGNKTIEMDLSRLTFTGALFFNVKFNKVKMFETHFNRCKFCNTRFSSVRFSNSNFRDSCLSECEFEKTDAFFTHFTNINLCKAQINYGKNECFFDNVEFKDVEFNSADLRKAHFGENIVFERCHLINIIPNQSIYKATFTDSPMIQQRKASRCIFIAHSFDPKTRRNVKKLKAAIAHKKKGISTIIEGSNLPVGGDLHTEIINKIRLSESVIGILENRDDWPSIWVIQEMAAAKALGKAVIPVCEKNVDSELAQKLLGVPEVIYYNKRKKDDWKAVIEKIIARI